ncbi:MAG TPA: DUF3883 domain-containing protein [Prolixibacteraceae bacterium]
MESSSAKDHIQQIRSEFDIGPEKTRVLDSLNGSISHLAESLYQKDTHFILELIQNAEDNQYHPGVDPDLFIIYLDQDPTDTPGADGALMLVNNEIGFQPEHVSAICEVGRSTKTDKRKGYIGEKGIGFKSVFTVSNQPYIFSGGYQFKFQEEPDPEVGFRFIVPTWIDNCPDILKPYIGKTCILLPLKSEKKILVKDQLQQIDPETILFLKKLKGLQIEINGEGAADVIRSDQERPLIEVVTGKGEAKYWLAEKECDVPSGVKEEKRAGIDSRVITVAFPLISSFPTNDTIYAFLPTNVQSGFKFLVNADFILTSNRESVRENLQWNLWLRDCIAPTFFQAFTELLNTRKYRFSPYRFIPLLDISRDLFFQPVAEEIVSGLRTRSVVWSFDGKSLLEPDCARFASKEFRHLLDPKHPPDQLISTPLVHPELEKEDYKRPLEIVGVKQLSPDEIIKCLTDESWLGSQQIDWFYTLYEFLSKQEWAKSSKLKNLNLVPTENGELICGQSRWVYFPGKQSREITKAYPDIIRYLGLRYLNHKLHKLIISQVSLLEWVKTNLGIEELNLSNICVHLIDKLSGDYANLECSKLIRVTRFIRDNYDEVDEKTKGRIRLKLPILLDNNLIIQPKPWSDEQPLVVPQSADPTDGWQILFPDPEDRQHMTVLSDQYLENESTESKKIWLKFFTEIGATEYPHPQKQVMQFYPYNYPSDLMDHIRHWVSAQGWRSYTVTDYKAPKWLKYLNLNPATSTELKRSNALLNWLEHCRFSGSETPEDRIYVEYSTAKRTYCYTNACPSEFAYCIINSAWFPSTKGQEVPGHVFLDKPEIREFFKSLFPYTKQPIGDGVISYLRIKTSATIEEIVGLLRDIASKPAAKSDAKLVSRIYSFLSERWNKNIREEFEKNSWILSTKPLPEWLNLNRAIWFDLPLGFEGIAYVDISSQYDDKYYAFFVKQLGISDKLDDESYAQALINLSQLSSPKSEAVESALEKIFPVLLKVVKGSNRPEWWNNFLSEVKVWTQNDLFFPPSDVYIPDDGELQRKMEKVGIQFAWRPYKDTFADYFALYQELGVRSLVDHIAISPEIKKENIEQQEREKTRLTTDAKKVISYYLRNSAGNDPRKLYETLKNDGKIESLLRTNEEQVTFLHTIFQLNGKTARENDAATFWDRENSKLYISVRHSQDELETEIPSIIARRLVIVQLAKDLENFIGRVLGCSPEKANRIIHKHNWSMPDEELAWIDSVLATTDEATGNGPSNNGSGGNGSGKGGTGTGGSSKGGTGSSKTRGGDSTTGGSGTGETGTGGTGGNTSGSGRTGPGSAATWHPRMISYLERSEGTSGEDSDHGTSDKDRQVGDAAINKVLKYESNRGRINAHYLGQTHEGWDIDSEETISEGVDAILGIKAIRRIEVKGKDGEWDGFGIGLSAAEFKKAQEYKDDYYLYVVENALNLEDNRPPYIIRNPASLITDYRMDYMWKKLSQSEEPVTDEQSKVAS